MPDIHIRLGILPVPTSQTGKHDSWGIRQNTQKSRVLVGKSNMPQTKHCSHPAKEISKGRSERINLLEKFNGSQNKLDKYLRNLRIFSTQKDKNHISII